MQQRPKMSLHLSSLEFSSSFLAKPRTMMAKMRFDVIERAVTHEIQWWTYDRNTIALWQNVGVWLIDKIVMIFEFIDQYICRWRTTIHRTWARSSPSSSAQDYLRLRMRIMSLRSISWFIPCQMQFISIILYNYKLYKLNSITDHNVFYIE